MPIPLLMREYLALSGFIGIGTVAFYLLLKDKIFLTWGFQLLLVVTAAYFSRHFFIFVCLLSVILLIISRRMAGIDRLAQYFLLLPVLPIDFGRTIPFPGLQQLFLLTYPRALAIFMLLPFFIASVLSKKGPRYRLDKYVLIYFIYIIILAFRETTITNVFRTAFIVFLDWFIVYFAVSRIVVETDDFRKIFKSMIFIAFILSLIAMNETLRHWRMYHALSDMLYLASYVATRGQLLRASASFGGPIPFGIFLSLMLSILIFLKWYDGNENNIYHNVFFLVLLTGCLCTLSRTPLIGMTSYSALFLLLTRKNVLKIVPIILAAAFLIFVLSPKLFHITKSSLPFIGTEVQETIDYRKKLLENGMVAIKRYPVTGSAKYEYINTPEIQELRQHGGHIGSEGVDIVNTYIGIALHAGLLGLTFFLFIFLILVKDIYMSFRSSTDKNAKMLGKMLFSLVISYMMMIFSASSTSFMPIYMWALIGLGAAYVKIIRKTNVRKEELLAVKASNGACYNSGIKT